LEIASTATQQEKEIIVREGVNPTTITVFIFYSFIPSFSIPVHFQKTPNAKYFGFAFGFTVRCGPNTAVSFWY
jgi:hypothetical protein